MMLMLMMMRMRRLFRNGNTADADEDEYESVVVQMVMGQTFRIRGPSSAGGQLCLLSKTFRKERWTSSWLARLRPSFPFARVVQTPYHTKLYTTTTSCNAILNHTKSHHTILVWSLHHTSPQLSRADQDWPKSPILGSTEESTWVYSSEESTPPTFCLHSPLGAATSRHQCFFIVSFPSTNLFRLCSKILWLRFEMSTAHIWTLACSGLERCFITAVCKRQIDYLDNLNNQLASAQTLI